MENKLNTTKNRRLLEELRVKEQEFLGRPVLVPDANGELKPGELKFNGSKSGTYSDEMVQSHQKIVNEKEVNFDGLSSMKEVSQNMELIFTDLIHLILPGFKVNIPNKVDDILNGADVTLFKEKEGKVDSIFSLDFFYNEKPGEVLWWKRKLFKNLGRALNANFSTVNYIQSGDKFFASKNCPVFTFPISKENLAKAMQEYEKGIYDTPTIDSLRQELRYAVYLQLEVLKKVLGMAPSKATKEKRPEVAKRVVQLLKKLQTLKNDLGDIENFNGNFNDETVKGFCEYLNKVLHTKMPTSLTKSLILFNETSNIKRKYKNGHAEKVEGFWQRFKKSIGLNG